MENYFTNKFIDKTVDIFIGCRKYVDYKLAFKLHYNEVITTLRDPFV